MVALAPQSRPARRLRALVLAGAAAAALHAAIPGDLFVRLLSGLEAKGRLLYYSGSTAGTVTREFYRLCRQRLRPGGMVAQWVPSHGLSVEEYRTIVRTFSQVFPHTSIWLNQVYAILLATPQPLAVDLEELAGRLARPAIAANLDKVELADPVAFLGTLGLDERGVGDGGEAGNPLDRLAHAPGTRPPSVPSLLATQEMEPPRSLDDIRSNLIRS